MRLTEPYGRDRGNGVGIDVGPPGCLKHQATHGKVCEQKSEELLLHQFECRADHDTTAPEVGFEFIEGGLDLPTVVVEALNMAVEQSRPNGINHHSDQRSWYTSGSFERRSGKAGVLISMGSVRDAYDCDLTGAMGWGVLTHPIIDRSVLPLTCRPFRSKASGIALGGDLLEEHLGVKGRTSWYETLEEMQKDLDAYLEIYNTKRGRTEAGGWKKGPPIRS